MDVYQPSGFGRKRRNVGHTVMSSMVSNSNGTATEYITPLSQHWRTVDGPSNNPITVEFPKTNDSYFPPKTNNEFQKFQNPLKKNDGPAGKNNPSTKFGDNIGFSVIMPAGM